MSTFVQYAPEFVFDKIWMTNIIKKYIISLLLYKNQLGDTGRIGLGNYMPHTQRYKRHSY